MSKGDQEGGIDFVNCDVGDGLPSENVLELLLGDKGPQIGDEERGAWCMTSEALRASRTDG